MRKYGEIKGFFIAIIIAVGWMYFANLMGWHVMTWEQIGKIVAIGALFLMAVAVIRLVFWGVFPVFYRTFDPDNRNIAIWEKLSDFEKYLIVSLLFVGLCILFGGIAGSA